MPENPAPQGAAEPIAIVGMACRFPDAANPADFLELVLTGRRAFRAMPPVRLDVTEYGDAESDAPGQLAAGAIGPGRAALIEGWRFDRAAYGVTQAAYQAADPAHWLALETAARALADGGFPGGQGLTRDRTGVIIGNTLTGEVSRATAMRSRWPYVRRVLRAALAAGEVSPERHAGVLEHAAAGFLAPFPEIGDDTLAGGLPGAIADRICGHFGFRGGGHAVDAAHSSSLLAIAAACSALAAGDLDAAIAGGVDISLDPHELAGLAGTGALAAGDMRVFDARPTGFLPGEGCGLAVLMRAADARAAGIPVYAEIAGWGVSSAGNPALTRPGSASLLLALRRAYLRADIDPADVQLIEGDGTGTASGDLAELTSLAEMRQASPRLAALGSVKANIGHTKAAAGAAGLIKATLAIAAGVIPPATGCVRPHPLIASEDARLRVPQAAEPWPERARLAGVSSVGPGGTSVHVILRRTREGRRRRAPGTPQLRGGGAAAERAGTTPAGGKSAAPARRDGSLPLPIPVLANPPRAQAFAFAAADRQALARELGRVAELASWLSDGELHDLACQAGRAAAGPADVRAGLVAGSQNQLAQLAGEAIALLPGLRPGTLATAPGIVLAEGGRGRVTLLFPGEGSFLTPPPRPGFLTPPPRPSSLPAAATASKPNDTLGGDPALHSAIVAGSLAGLRWLDELGLDATAGVGHGLGEITGLVWAGCLSEADATRLVALRAALLEAPPAERTALVCVDADGEQARRLCAGSGLVIAAYNGPRCHVLAGPVAAVRDLARRLAEDSIPARLVDSPQGCYSPAMADRVPPMRSIVREFSFRPPSRRLISTVTGAEVAADDDLGSMLCTQLTSPIAFAGALGLAAANADLLLETGPGEGLSRLAADCCDVPAISLAAGPADDDAAARAAAALFASGAVATLAPLFEARPARPIDIWRERIFIPSPCGTTSPRGTAPVNPGEWGGVAGPGPAAAADGTGQQAEPQDGQRQVARAPGLGGPAPASAGAGPVPTAPAAPGATPSGAAGSTDAPAPPADALAGETQSAAANAPSRDPEHTLSGGPWIRCFTAELRPAPAHEPTAAGASWRVRGTADATLGKLARRIFADDADAGTVLALVGDPAEPAACAVLLGAAKEAADNGRLVVITAARGLTGFCASLHAERPGLGITLIRTALGPDGLAPARRFAVAAPGQFREVILDEEGTATEPVMVATDPAADGTFPLGPADVVLVTGITRAGDLECATSLASRGAALAVIAPPGPEDPQLTACLAQLRAAGARVSRKKADLGDPGQVAAAVRSLERGLGPVTAMVHGAASGPVERLARLSEPVLRGFLVSQRARFSNVAGAVAVERLRVLVTFGSVAARYGRAEGACDALASELLAEQAWCLAGTRPRCRVLHIDWAPWAGPEPGSEETTPLPVEEGSRLLLSLLTTPDIPPRVAVHGRLGVPAPQALRPWQATPGAAGRFLETVRVHYPGVELIADTRLSLQADPYLADHRIDGVAVFPAAMVLEALAQAASALAGGPQRHLTDVCLAAPVVLPVRADGEEAVIRVCALRTGDAVETVLRCAETGFRLIHASAVFRVRPELTGGRPAGPGWPDPGWAGHQAGTDGVPPGGMVDGTDLYGQVYFQAGRFRRVAFLPEATSRACRALVRGGDDQPWFGAVPGPVDAPLVLGSPGLNDATLHVLQACLPHRRLLPTACESVIFSGQEVRGALRVQAVRRPGSGDATGGDWDVVAADATGQPVVTWRGVRLRDVGALARTAPWHPALLAISMESRAAEFGLDGALRAVISCGSPPRSPAPAAGTGPRDGWADTVAGRGPLDGFELTVRAARPVACRWQAVSVPRDDDLPLDEALVTLQRRLEARPRETLAAARARLATIESCLAALGREPGTSLALEDACDGGWIVVRSPDVTVACTVTEISGVPAPVAVAVASRLAQSGTEGGTGPGQRGQGQPIGSLS